MKRVRLIIAYDGTNYCGWQVQINGITVEEVLNKALKDLLNEEIAAIYGNRKRFVPYESQLFNSCA